MDRRRDGWIGGCIMDGGLGGRVDDGWVMDGLVND